MAPSVPKQVLKTFSFFSSFFFFLNEPSILHDLHDLKLSYFILCTFFPALYESRLVAAKMKLQNLKNE